LFERVLEVVPAEEEQRLGSRQRWKTYQHADFELKKFDM
jgi:DNA polymerase-3 subunit chi